MKSLGTFDHLAAQEELLPMAYLDHAKSLFCERDSADATCQVSHELTMYYYYLEL